MISKIARLARVEAFDGSLDISGPTDQLLSHISKNAELDEYKDLLPRVRLIRISAEDMRKFKDIKKVTRNLPALRVVECRAVRFCYNTSWTNSQAEMIADYGQECYEITQLELSIRESFLKKKAWPLNPAAHRHIMLRVYMEMQWAPKEDSKSLIKVSDMRYCLQ